MYEELTFEFTFTREEINILILFCQAVVVDVHKSLFWDYMIKPEHVEDLKKVLIRARQLNEGLENIRLSLNETSALNIDTLFSLGDWINSRLLTEEQDELYHDLFVRYTDTYADFMVEESKRKKGSV